MKAISTIIAAIILVVITIGLVSTAYLFAGGVITGQMSKVISLVDAKAHKVIVRNDGTATISSDEISISVNGQEVEIINPQQIEPKETAILKFVPPEPDMGSAKVNVMGVSNTLSYTTDIVPQESKVIPDTAALFHMNENAGDDILDDTGTNIGMRYDNDFLNYDLDNPPQWTTDCKYGSCLKFDGLDDYINITHSDSLDIKDAITVGFWVKVHDLQEYNDIVNKWCENVFAIWIGNDNEEEGKSYIYASVNGTSKKYLSSDSNGYYLNTEQWYHVAFTYDSNAVENNFNLYLNGILADKSTVNIGPLWTNNEAVQLGTFELVDFSNCTIDEVMIVNRSLTQEEILDSIYG